MFATVKHILTYASFAIILLHGIVPHVHEHELDEDLHFLLHQIEPSNFLEAISLFFHESTSETEISHDFLNSDEIDFCNFIADYHTNSFTEISFFKDFTIIVSNCFTTYQSELNHQFKTDASHTRPPPTA